MPRTTDKDSPVKPVTLKDVAQHLGLSVTTVARSLRDGHKIGADTVRLVRDTASALGYVRNLDGLRLRTGRTLSLLAILCTADDSEVGDPGAAGLLAGMQKRLIGSDYSLHNAPILISERSVAQLASILRQRPTDGVFIDHIEPDDPRIDLLCQEDIPFIAYGRGGAAARHPYFEIDNVHAAYTGTKALIENGFSAPALIEADTALNFAQDRVQGYRRALHEAGLPFDPARVLHGPTDAAAIRSAVRSLALDQNPDSYVCSNEIFLFGTLAGIRDAGIRPIRLTGFSVRTATNLGAYLGLPMVASFYSREATGWTLADLMLKRLAGAPPAELQIIDRTELRFY